MAIGTGISAQLGIAEEVTYGTGVTPARYLDFTSESIELKAERIESKGLRTGQRLLRSDRFVHNRKGAEGDLEFEVASKGFGLIFKHMLGSVVTTAPGATAKLHTAALGDGSALSLTAQMGRPNTGGTVQVFNYEGGKIPTWEMSCDVDGILELKLGCDFEDENTSSPVLGTATYAASTELLTYIGGVINVGGSAVDVSKFSIKGDMGLNTERYFIRNSGLKKAPLVADLAKITGTLELEFQDMTTYNRFANGTTAAFSAVFASPTQIEATHFPTVTISAGLIRLDGSTPTVGDAGIVKLQAPFMVLDDGTATPFTIAYKTADVLP